VGKHAESVVTVALTPTGDQVASTDGERLTLWTLSSGRSTPTRSRISLSTALAFAPDGVLWESPPWGPVGPRPAFPAEESSSRVLPAFRYTSFAMTEQQQTLGDTKGQVWVWHESAAPPAKADGKEESTAPEIPPAKERIYRTPILALSDEGRDRFLALTANQVGVWQWVSSAPQKPATTVRLVEQNHPGNIFCAALARGEDTWIVGRDEKGLWRRRWVRDNFTPCVRIEGGPNQATCLAVSPDGRVLAAGHPDGTVDLWELASRP
jgi:WD40 repeat protein